MADAITLDGLTLTLEQLELIACGAHVELDTKAIDFVLAFPQADLDVPVYMELPAGMDLSGELRGRAHRCVIARVRAFGWPMVTSA